MGPSRAKSWGLRACAMMNHEKAQKHGRTMSFSLRERLVFLPNTLI
jgi:hypothetical protein